MPLLIPALMFLGMALGFSSCTSKNIRRSKATDHADSNEIDNVGADETNIKTAFPEEGKADGNYVCKAGSEYFDDDEGIKAQGGLKKLISSRSKCDGFRIFAFTDDAHEASDVLRVQYRNFLKRNKSATVTEINMSNISADVFGKRIPRVMPSVVLYYKQDTCVKSSKMKRIPPISMAFDYIKASWEKICEREMEKMICGL